MTVIGKHPRCNLGLISSMTKDNLNETIEGLNIEIHKLLPKKFSIICQEDHDIIKFENNNIPQFFRNMKKLLII